MITYFCARVNSWITCIRTIYFRVFHISTRSVGETALGTVARGPVPRDRSRAPETGVRDPDPERIKRAAASTVARGPVPRHATDERCLLPLGLEDLNVYSTSPCEDS